MNCNIRLSTIALALFAANLTSTLHADQFWASQLGGGSEDVFIDSLTRDKYKARSNSDMVKPEVGEDGSLTYDIKIDSLATVSYPNLGAPAIESVGESPIVNDQVRALSLPSSERSTTDSTDEDATPNAVTVNAGEWRIRFDPTTQPTTPSTFSRARAESVTSISDEIDKEAPIARVDIDESPYSMAISVFESATVEGTLVTMTARVTDNTGIPLESESISGKSYSIDRAVVKAAITYADGTVERLRLKDSGELRHGDTKKSDRIYSAKHHFRETGIHAISFAMDGVVNGMPFKRESTTHISVGKNRLKTVSKSIAATTGSVLDLPLEEGRYGLPLEVTVGRGSMPDYVNTRAEVWAVDSAGNDSVVGWIGGLVEPKPSEKDRWTVPFTFHSGWLARGDYNPPFTLQNIEFIDIDSGDQIAYDRSSIEISDMQQPVRPASVSTLRNRGALAEDGLLSNEPSAEMMNGVHPSLLDSEIASGLLQASCPSCYAAISLISFSSASPRSGLSQTTVGVSQLRVDPLQRDGFARLASS